MLQTSYNIYIYSYKQCNERLQFNKPMSDKTFLPGSQVTFDTVHDIIMTYDIMHDIQGGIVGDRGIVPNGRRKINFSSLFPPFFVNFYSIFIFIPTVFHHKYHPNEI